MSIYKSNASEERLLTGRAKSTRTVSNNNNNTYIDTTLGGLFQFQMKS